VELQVSLSAAYGARNSPTAERGHPANPQKANPQKHTSNKSNKSLATSAGQQELGQGKNAVPKQYQAGQLMMLLLFLLS
jgi:hypothetical protein